ncbi:MAG: serine/threonine protein kinase [Planctomycetes bacterium]|nr:serine/threonine protein kinase [Planctomycetota bacterium]
MSERIEMQPEHEHKPEQSSSPTKNLQSGPPVPDDGGETRAIDPADMPHLLRSDTVKATLTWDAATVGQKTTPHIPARKQFTVPGYEILGKLGEGGMGVVFKAIQLKANRVVALKMVGSGGVSKVQIDRFVLEAKAAAGLDHVNIVRVFEVGEADGLPFFSMEHCPGGSLASQLRGTPLQPRLAATIMKALAEALQTAHNLSVVHRDLKPANVLLAPNPAYHSTDWARVSYQGVAAPTIGVAGGAAPPPFLEEPNAYIPKLADFGLAKMMDADATQTRTGAIMGTPSYMSPEQARGATKEIGPLSDVYSLGAILYELVAGRPPFVTASAVETLKKVAEDEPNPPTHYEPKTPRDIETICMKCLEKRREKRYTSAQALADDLGRYLSGEPIHARPAGMVERSVKWVRRRPALAVIYSLAVVLLVLLLVFNWRLTVQRNRANENFALAMAAVDQFLTQVSEHPVLKEHAFEELRGDLLHGAVAFLQKFVDIEGTDPALVAEQGRACMRLALIQKMLENRHDAIALNQKALELFAGLGRVQEVPALQRDLGTVHQRLGNLYAEDKNRDRALTELQIALSVRRSLAELRDCTVLDKVQLARTWISLGFLYTGAGEEAPARASYQAALDTLQPVAAANPKDLGVQDALAQAHYSLAAALRRLSHDPKEAREHFEQAIAIWETLPTKTEYQVNLARALGNLANMLDRQQAVDAHEKARAIWEEQARRHPSVQHYQAALARSYYNIAILLDRPQASPMIQKAIDLERVLLQGNPNSKEHRHDLARYFDFQADNFLQQNRYAEAARSRIELSRISSEDEQVRIGLASCRVLAKRGQHTESARAVEDLAGRFTKGASLYQAAAALAVIAKVAAEDEESTVAAEKYVAASLALLEKSRDRGFFDLSQNREDLATRTDWTFLRAREDFQAFLKMTLKSSNPQK